MEMPLTAGKSGCHERVIEAVHCGDVDSAIVQVSARFALAGEHLVSHWVKNYARDEFALVLERHSDVEHREAMGEVGCAIERIDVPAVVGCARVAAAFLGNDGVRREMGTQPIDNELLGGAVGFG